MELILSWTPREYKAFIKGSQHRTIDRYQEMARQAMFNRYAANAKNAKEKKMFDADKARERLNKGDEGYLDSRKFDKNKLRKVHAAMSNYFKTANK